MFDAFKSPTDMGPFKLMSLPMDEKYVVTGVNPDLGVAYLRHFDAPPYQENEQPYFQRGADLWVRACLTYNLKNSDESIPVGAICYASYAMRLTKETRESRKGKWKSASTKKNSGMFHIFMPSPGMTMEFVSRVMSHHNKE